jgi:VWFA-related protein
MQAATRWSSVVAALAVSAAASVWAQEAPKKPSFPSDVEMVTVDAVVVDSHGNPVTGLTREDFVVKEDGKPQSIATFEAFAIQQAHATASTPSVGEADKSETKPPAARSFAIVFDDLGLAARHAEAARRGLSDFVEGSLQAGDQVILATTSGSLWVKAQLPKGLGDLQARISKLRGLDDDPAMVLDPISDYEAYSLVERGASGTSRVVDRWQRTGYCVGPGCGAQVWALAQSVDAARRSRTLVTLGVLRKVSQTLMPMRGRKSVLLVSKGFIEDPNLPLREVEAVSQEANAAIYFLDGTGLRALERSGQPDASAVGGAPDPYQVTSIGFESRVLDSAGAQDLALDTGGFTVRNTNDIGVGAARIANESRAFYLIGFRPPADKKPGQWRKLRVEVKDKGLTVRARRGYTIIAKDATKTSAVAVADAE